MDNKWRRVTNMTTGPAVQYFVEMSPEETQKDWEQRNIIPSEEKANEKIQKMVE
jgi:hypothetical protein